MNILHDRPQEPERSYNRAYWESLHDHDEIEEPEDEVPTVAKDVSQEPSGDVAKSQRVPSQYGDKARKLGIPEDELRDVYE